MPPSPPRPPTSPPSHAACVAPYNGDCFDKNASGLRSCCGHIDVLDVGCSGGGIRGYDASCRGYSLRGGRAIAGQTSMEYTGYAPMHFGAKAVGPESLGPHSRWGGC
mmetsp:Transcript_44338/g.128977  ORF Transcript_44338/g.128977 Transcript_44338/m.128977 type:complete len:107 (-) Transcript_44338:278-598(-)